MSIALQIRDLSKHHVNTIFSQVNLDVTSPAKIGLIGDNGIGKSTLVKLISGQDTPDEGQIIWTGNPRISYLPQEFSTNEFDLSGGMQKILKLTDNFYSGADVILLDEPDNHLDQEHKEWFSQLVADFSGLLIVISHDRHFLRNFVDKIWLVEDHKVKEYPGNYNQFLKLYQHQKESELHLYQTQERERQRLKDYIAKLKVWVKQSDKFAGRYSSALKRYDRHVASMIDRPREKKRIKLTDSVARHPNRKTALHLEHLSKSYVQTQVLTDINLHVFCGEKIAISAPNGSGKTTLLSIISGALPFDAGKLRVGNNLKLGVYSQDHYAALSDDSSPLETLRARIAYTEPQAVSHLARFLFSYEQMRGKIKFLSGGQKSRLQLACFLATNPDILILDEPTNHLDITTIQLLEDYLKTYCGAIVLVSHDQEFVDSVVNQVYLLDNGVLQPVQ